MRSSVGVECLNKEVVTICGGFLSQAALVVESSPDHSAQWENNRQPWKAVKSLDWK